MLRCRRTRAVTKFLAAWRAYCTRRWYRLVGRTKAALRIQRWYRTKKSSVLLHDAAIRARAVRKIQSTWRMYCVYRKQR
jgi:hypothetical protein